MQLVRNIRALAFLALPFVFASMPVLAEEAEAGKSEGLPQFDVSLFPEELFWLAISFALLYVLMSKIALPRVAKTQDNRKNIIASEIEAARAASDAAQATVATVDKSLREARAKAQASVSEMLAKVTEESSAHQETQEKELLRQLHRAEADIAVTREAALQSVKTEAAALANSVVDKILNSKGRVNA